MVLDLTNRWGRLAVLSGASAAVSLGGLAGCGAFPTVDEARVIEADHRPGAALDVATRNGRIQVRRSDVDAVVITARLRARTQERLDATRIIAEHDESGALAIRVLWPDGRRFGNEGCSFEIETPGADGVRLDASNGSLSVTGLSGRAWLDTSNGSITVRDHDGPVIADTSNGAVRVTNATGPVEIDTSNGGVSVALAPGATGPVRVDTSNGGVRLTLPESFTGELVLDTSNGRVSFESAPSLRAVSAGRRHARLVLGDGGEASVVTTSNGSIGVGFVENPGEE